MEIVALSGGKDSTAMALRLAEVEPSDARVYLITPTGDELPPMQEHWQRLEHMLDKSIVRVPAPTLRELIVEQNCLPNWRMRWCTRLIKIEPCIRYLAGQPEQPVLCVGLRADEEHRGGLYDETVTNRYPLREWGWGFRDVVDYLDCRGIDVPERTDCARCPLQRLYEWHNLWRDWPEYYASAEADEARTGHTFRSPGRDTWPAALKDLRKEFESGRVPKRRGRADGPCRVCRM